MKLKPINRLIGALFVLILTPGLLNAQSLVLKTGTTNPQIANVSVTSTSDPAGHSCCVIAPPSLLEIFLQEGELVIREVGGGNAVPWLDFNPMPIDGNMQFTGQHRATVAGFSNILNVISGTISVDRIEVQMVIGADGGLPTGQAITHNLAFAPLMTEWFLNEIATPNLSLQAALGIAFVHIEDKDIPPDFGIDLFLTMHTNGNSIDSDWWIVMLSDNVYYSFDLASGTFQPGLIPTYQGPTVDVLEPAQLLNNFQPPSNDFTIVFGVDADPNSMVDLNTLQLSGFHYYF